MTQSSTIDHISEPLPSADVPRIHREDLPTDLNSIISRIKHVITLVGVTRLELTTEHLVVERTCSPLDEIVPAAPDTGIDVAKVLGGLTELDELGVSAHALISMQACSDAIAAKNLRVVGVVAPSPVLMSAWLGMGADDPAPLTCLGHRILYSHDDSEKFVVLASPTTYVNDAIYGILIDPFLEEDK